MATLASQAGDYIANVRNPPQPPPATWWPLTNLYRKSPMGGSVSLGSLWEPAGGWFSKVKLLWALRTLDAMCPGTIFSLQTAGRDSSLGDRSVPWRMSTASQAAPLRPMYNRWLQFGITRASQKITFNIPLLSRLLPQNGFYCLMSNKNQSPSVFFCHKCLLLVQNLAIYCSPTGCY